MNRQRILSLLVLCAGAVSCGRDDTGITTSGGPVPTGAEMTIEPAVQTKAAVQGGDVPDDYTVYLSAYFNNTTSQGTSSSYLRAEPFRKCGESWHADPPVYWPLGGTLDFLCLASREADVRQKSHWYENNAARGMEMEIEDGKCLDSEVLFARSSSRSDSDRCVPLSFRHSQSWLRFEFAHHQSGTVMIDSIVICKPYLGGKLRVDNGVFLDCTWDFHGHFKKDWTMPGIRHQALCTDTVTVDVLLPEQESCPFRVYWRQKDPGEPSWENCTRKECSQIPAIADPWHMGTRTVYTMIILKDMTWTVSVQPWSEKERTITIP